MLRGRAMAGMEDSVPSDMSDYDDVREHAGAICARLDDGTMPCDRPWHDEKGETFRVWIDQGRRK